MNNYIDASMYNKYAEAKCLRCNPSFLLYIIRYKNLTIYCNRTKTCFLNKTCSQYYTDKNNNDSFKENV